MEWDKSLESDIAVIDHEHKELFKQLSNLKDEANSNRIPEMLDFLREYVVKHFAHEQIMHKKTGYPKAEAHKQAHIDFIRSFTDLEAQFAFQGNSLEMLQKVIGTVHNWLKEHIMGQDREFNDYFKAIGKPELD